MNYFIIPLTNDPNQNFVCTILVDGINKNFRINLSYNEIALYWIMKVSDAYTGDIIIDSIPLVTGEYPSADLFGQYEYLGIGSALILKLNNSSMDFPDDTVLGTDFILVWGNTNK